MMASVQVNIRTTPFLADELDRMVQNGYFRNRTEAVNEGIRILIRRYQLKNTKERIDRMSPKISKYRSSKKLVHDMHEEEDA